MNLFKKAIVLLVIVSFAKQSSAPFFGCCRRRRGFTEAHLGLTTDRLLDAASIERNSADNETRERLLEIAQDPIRGEALRALEFGDDAKDENPSSK